MLSEPAMTRALERAGLDAPVRFAEVTPSTQALALAWAADGAPEWSIVAAAHQTEGRGRLGRTWVDVASSALLFSFVLRPELEATRGGLLTLLAGLAMAEAVDEVADQRAACKWPNDVLVAGRKAAGILAESVIADGRLAHVVIGVGANLGAPPDDLPEAGAIDAEDEALLASFLRAFASRYEPAAPGFARGVVDAYRGRCATLGERVLGRTTDGSTVEGEAIDVDHEGGLVIRTDDGDRVVRFGEVEHLRERLT